MERGETPRRRAPGTMGSAAGGQNQTIAPLAETLVYGLGEVFTGLGYLARFKEVLPGRAAYAKHHSEPGTPFYRCAILNSIPVRELVKSCSSVGRGFGAPSAMEHLGIRKFDPGIRLHAELAECPGALHRFKRKGREKEASKLEERNERRAARLFSLGRG